MALARRSGARFEASIWPGFVDAMTALLLILMFVLSIFMIVQFSLRSQVTGQTEQIKEQEVELSRLATELSALSEVLSLERVERAEAESQLSEVRATLTRQRTESDRLTAALAAMTAARADVEQQLSETVNARDELAAALAASRDELDEAAEAARLAAARREAMQALIADLEGQKSDADEKIAALDAANARALALAAALEAEKENLVLDKSVLEAEASILESTRAELAAQRITALAALAALEAEKAKLESENIDLTTNQAALEAERSRLLSDKEALEAAERAVLEKLAAAQSSLTAEEEARLAEAAAAEALRKKLENSSAELDAVTLALEQTRKQAEQTLTLLAAAEAAKARLEGDLETLQTDLESSGDDFDREAALRKIAEAELAKADAKSAEDARAAALLNAQVGELRDQLGSIQALLDAAEARDSDQKVQIAELGQKLNAALAQKVGELARFRSEFFGRMRDVLGGRGDIQIVGDRFVFQSEVLFDPGQATLDPIGEVELAKLGKVLREVSSEISEDLNWILRVDGHTDKIPIKGGRFRNNWELSQARALSVVEYLIENEGVPPQRLAATGFGEFQPIADGDSRADLARNRRIEFKFTER